MTLCCEFHKDFEFRVKMFIKQQDHSFNLHEYCSHLSAELCSVTLVQLNLAAL